MDTTFLGKETIADGAKLFRFEKPAGFDYVAGQSIDLTIPAGMHAFSLVSAPHEDYIAVATRMRGSDFKNALDKLNAGDKVQIDGPFGSFFLHENTARGAVWLVGGIGVTPFYSMAKDAAERKLAHSLYMAYSNNRPVDAPFVKELEALAIKNQNFKFLPLFGERIDEQLVKEFAPMDKNPVYYMAGPQGMVTAMRTLLKGMGVSNDDIRFEEFTGY